MPATAVRMRSRATRDRPWARSTSRLSQTYDLAVPFGGADPRADHVETGGCLRPCVVRAVPFDRVASRFEHPVGDRSYAPPLEVEDLDRHLGPRFQRHLEAQAASERVGSDRGHACTER